MKEQLQKIYQNAPSIPAFYKSIDEEGFEYYVRNGAITGLYMPNSQRKFRLKTLGFGMGQIMLLNQEYRRLMELEENQDKELTRTKQKNIKR